MLLKTFGAIIRWFTEPIGALQLIYSLVSQGLESDIKLKGHRFTVSHNGGGGKVGEKIHEKVQETDGENLILLLTSINPPGYEHRHHYFCYGDEIVYLISSPNTPQGRHWYPHFTYKETKAQWGTLSQSQIVYNSKDEWLHFFENSKMQSDNNLLLGVYIDGDLCSKLNMVIWR